MGPALPWENHFALAAKSSFFTAENPPIMTGIVISLAHAISKLLRQ
jgi:hypothetical protein